MSSHHPDMIKIQLPRWLFDFLSGANIVLRNKFMKIASMKLSLSIYFYSPLIEICVSLIKLDVETLDFLLENSIFIRKM